MRVTKSSTTAHLLPTRPINRNLDNRLETVFYELKKLLQPYESSLQLKRDVDNQYELWAPHAFLAKRVNPKTKMGLQFGAVIKCKKFVGLYLYSLYIQQTIKDTLSDDLKALLGGQACFHITMLNDTLLNEIDAPVNKCWDFYLDKIWAKDIR